MKEAQFFPAQLSPHLLLSVCIHTRILVTLSKLRSSNLSVCLDKLKKMEHYVLSWDVQLHLIWERRNSTFEMENRTVDCKPAINGEFGRSVLWLRWLFMTRDARLEGGISAAGSSWASVVYPPQQALITQFWRCAIVLRGREDTIQRGPRQAWRNFWSKPLV